MKQGSAPEADREDSGSRRRHAVWLIGAAWVLVAIALQLLRQRGVPLYDTIWAEDGDLFLSDALRSPLGAFLQTEGGYLHTVPRAFAALATVLPLDWAAAVFGIGATATVALLSVYVFFALRAVTPDRVSRSVIAVLFVLAPAAWWESLGNVATLQYAFLFAAFVALLDRPTSRASAIVGSGIVAAAALSTSIALLLVPLAGWVVWRRPGRSRLIGVVFLIAIAVQGAALFAAIVLGLDPSLARYPVGWGASDLTALPRVFGLRVGGSALVGDRALEEVWTAMGSTFGWVSFAVVVVLSVACVAWAHPGARPFVILALVYAGATFAMPAVARGTDHFEPVGGEVSFNGNRFVLVSVLFLYLAVFLSLSGRSRSSPVRRVARWSLAAAVALLVVVNFQVENIRSLGPRWEPELEAAAERCRTGGGPTVLVRITPNFGEAGWFATLPCREVLS